MRGWKRVERFDRLPALGAGVSLVDSHCHLDMTAFDDDRTAVVARARQAGVETIVTIGAGGSMAANHAALRLAEEHAGVFATVGIHPHEANMVTDALLGTIEELARRPKVVAIGETGLDYHYDHSPREVQRDAFRRFVALARAVGLPLVVHLRDADDDALEILRSENAREVGGVIHCFSSDACAARAFLDLGFDISFSGIVTFKATEAVRDAARVVPADRFLVETDAPFLAPVPYRGRRNESALVVQTAAVLAELRGASLQQVAASTSANAARLFPALTTHYFLASQGL